MLSTPTPCGGISLIAIPLLSCDRVVAVAPYPYSHGSRDQASAPQLDEPYRTMVVIAACLGLRASEIMGLQWSDFDWVDRTVLIRRGVVNGRPGDTKTEASRKALPVDPSLAEALQELRGNQAPQTGMDDWLFGNRFGRPRSQQDILRRHIKPAAVQAGLGKFGWHTFRHSYSTLLRSMGADIKVQQELLRHSTVQSTMNVYTQAVSEQKRLANSAVVGLLFGRNAFLPVNGNQQALTAAALVIIQSESSDWYCGA